CRLCKKKFTRGGHLKTHMLVQTGERPHECSVCKKTFIESGTMKKHLLTHTGEK
ncbi:hypothetical protein CAPTEDRAFT_31914, partial [Capitella teleta]